jgi:hypothetical protein
VSPAFHPVLPPMDNKRKGPILVSSSVGKDLVHLDFPVGPRLDRNEERS